MCENVCRSSLQSLMHVLSVRRLVSAKNLRDDCLAHTHNERTYLWHGKCEREKQKKREQLQKFDGE